MEFQHVNVKIPVEGELPVTLDAFTPVFHEWIRQNALGELLIDVADYRHVPDGPGVMLIGHATDYAIDHAGGVYGLLYNRKAKSEGTNADRYRAALASAAKSCQLLESEFEGLTFSRTRMDLFINDRALAPNTPQTLAAFQPEFEAFFKETFGADCTLEHTAAPRERFGVTVTSANPIDFAKLA